MINFDEFKKVEMRIGEILSVEIVPDADKLLKLTVDVGEEAPRTIVSGIREYIDNPETLVGTKKAFVCNLEPRMLRGIESQGMLLAVGGDAGFTFLSPDTDVTPGSPLT